MPPSGSRREARARLLRQFEAALDRLLPEDESVPLRGRRFADFEEQVEALGDALTASMLQERLELDPAAAASSPGRCPRCGAAEVRWRDERTRTEYLSRRGPVVVDLRRARCRACDFSFSPSGS